MSRRSLALLLTLSALWGASYLFIKVALEDVFSAWSIVSIRTMLAALVLLPLAAKLGVLGSLRGRLGPIVVLSLVQVAGPLTLIGLGEEHIASSLTGILVATAPIFTFLLAFALSGEQRDSATALVGVAIGIVGVGMLLGVDAGGESGAIAGGLMVILAAFGYAVAAWYLKRNLSGVEPVATVAGTQVVAALVTLPLGLTHIPDAAPALDAVASLLALGVLCTGIAFVIFHSLVASDGPSRASLVGYIAPVFSIFYGVALLDESFTAWTAAGLVLILGGSWLAAGGQLPARRRDVAAAGEPHGGPDTPLLEGGPERGDRIAA
ncbi:MAG TPA: DMT family transporter [Thermoleophilaceae bacterium]|jgi:drug/metabolite transporter (DMT)-like permease|nr:DMT family transporter [Thermoleophilaceae bacterium]